jgi:NADPH2:quinone reductase
MKAVRVAEFGGVDAMKYEEIPLPEPGEGEARVKIEVIGVNFLDIYQRMGRYQGPLPSGYDRCKSR